MGKFSRRSKKKMVYFSLRCRCSVYLTLEAATAVRVHHQLICYTSTNINNKTNQLDSIVNTKVDLAAPCSLAHAG